MAYKIIWSQAAADTFERIIIYHLFRGSDKENIHEALITKHNVLHYQIIESAKTVELLIFWDTRQNPKKKQLRRK